MNAKHFFALITACVLLACKTAQHPSNGSSPTLTADGKLWASLWHQRSAEYKALCFQAYNIAHWRLDMAMQKNYTKPLAIVTDIDETVLDNSPNTVSQALQGKGFDQQAWYKWTEKAMADTIPGAAYFLKYAASKPVTIFYITNREENERAATLKNLNRFGLPNADNAHLLLKQNTSGKESRRQEVLKNFEVVLLIGDNLSDFSSIFDKQTEANRINGVDLLSGSFGSRFIALPNTQYGDWEGALFQYNYQMKEKEKEQLIRKAVKPE